MSIVIEHCHCGNEIKQKNGKFSGRTKKNAVMCASCKKKLVLAYKRDVLNDPFGFKAFVENMAKKTGYTVAQLLSVAMMYS